MMDNRVWTTYTNLLETKSDGGRRVKPKGVDLLFNGTDVQSNRTMIRNGTYTVLLTDPTGWWRNDYLLTASTVGPGPSSYNLASKYWANRLLKEVRDTDLNLAQAFAERAQTEKMFVDYGKRLLKAYSAVKRGRPNEVLNALLGTKADKGAISGYKKVVKDTTGVASDTWLAWQYGVRPLISDLKGAVKEYYKVRQTQPLIRSYTLRASSDERMGGVQLEPWTSVYNPAAVRSSDLTQKAAIRAHVEFQDSAQAWDVSAQRLGLTDPILLAWELIPYSFVIDWFVNVGEFLEASGTITGLKRVGIHVTTTTAEYSRIDKGGGSASRQFVVKSRTFWPFLPNASLRIKANPLTVSHVTSALALIRQVRF
jgi:hypothetical protein